MNKLSKKITLSIIGSFIGIATGLAIALPISNNILKNPSIANVLNKKQAADENKVIPLEVNDQNANLSTNNGPITFLENTITALDWYGNKMWDKDLSTIIPDMNGRL